MNKPPMPPAPPNRVFKQGFFSMKETKESKERTRKWKQDLKEWKEKYGVRIHE